MVAFATKRVGLNRRLTSLNILLLNEEKGENVGVETSSCLPERLVSLMCVINKEKSPRITCSVLTAKAANYLDQFTHKIRN